MKKYVVNANVHHLPELSQFIIAKFRDEFEEQTGHNFKCWGEEIPVKMQTNVLYDLVIDAMMTAGGGDANSVRRLDLGKEVIEFSISPNGSCLLKVFIYLNLEDDDYYDYEEDGKSLIGEALIATLEAAGQQEIVDSFVKKFKSDIKKIHDESRTSMIRWIFDAGHMGSRDRTFQIKKDWDISREFYPWINSSLQEYYEAFIKSRSQIMVAFGPPGTGKTSFIKDMICEMNLNAFISYDLKVLTSDSTFVRYLTDSIFDAIIIEDADELLTSNRGEYNKVIAKILNISDGLIKLPQKKLIFTTNLPKVEDIDPAIIRPGRCFDVIEFRKLSREEAEVVAVKVGVKLPPKPEGKDTFSLAEIFYEKEVLTSNDPFTKNRADKLKRRTVGFV